MLVVVVVRALALRRVAPGAGDVAGGKGVLQKVQRKGLVERSITADRLTAHLEDLVAARGAPAVLRSDNGPEFISEAMADWAGTRTGLSYIPPGSPWRNGYVESFNSRIRDECLNINSFYSLLHAQVIIGANKSVQSAAAGSGPQRGHAWASWWYRWTVW